jgi:hypothetical protein
MLQTEKAATAMEASPPYGARAYVARVMKYFVFGIAPYGMNAYAVWVFLYNHQYCIRQFCYSQYAFRAA